MPGSIGARHVRKIFEEFGLVFSVAETSGSRGPIYMVKYFSKQEAQHAIRALDGTLVENSAITVRRMQDRGYRRNQPMSMPNSIKVTRHKLTAIAPLHKPP